MKKEQSEEHTEQASSGYDCWQLISGTLKYIPTGVRFLTSCFDYRLKGMILAFPLETESRGNQRITVDDRKPHLMEECQPINTEEMMAVENHHFATHNSLILASNYQVLIV